MKRAGLYFWRALWWRCPECGTKPVFVPLRRVRSLRDWFTPLDGCPRCGYPYERETGYFLLATWAVNYGLGSVLGIAIYMVLEFVFHLPLRWLLIGVIGPVMLFNLLFARHAKSLFLAIDHFFDPHRRGGDGDGGSRVPRVEPPPPAAPPRPHEPAAVR